MRWDGIKLRVELEFSDVKVSTENKEEAITKIVEDYKEIYKNVIIQANIRRGELGISVPKKNPLRKESIR